MQPVPQGQLELQGLRDPRVLMVQRVPRDQREQPELRVRQVPREQLELQGLRVRRVLMVQRVPLDQRGQPELLEQPVKRVRLGLQVLKGQQVQPVPLEPPVLLEPRDQPGPLGQPEMQARVSPGKVHGLLAVILLMMLWSTMVQPM